MRGHDNETVFGLQTGRGESALRVVRRTLELDVHRGLGARVPRVMPRGDAINLAGADISFGAIPVHDVKRPGDDVADVFDLAVLRIDDGLDAFGPAPSRLERVAADLPPGQVHQLHESRR